MKYVYLPNPPFPSLPSLLPLCCRIFVVGIGFFSLCFLMTSLGGQFSAKRLGDSPFTIRTEGMFSCKLPLVRRCNFLTFRSSYPLSSLDLKAKAHFLTLNVEG